MASKNRGGTTRWKTRNLRVLVDMDGVLCDFEGNLLDSYQKLHPNDPFVPLDKRKTFYAADQYEHLGTEYAKNVRAIIESKGFYRNLPPIPGACNAVKELASLDNVDVYLCTSQLSKSFYGPTEKLEWVEEHLGRDWCERVIIGKDKTLVLGDLLIDDRPNVKGTMNPPPWKQVLFTCCHNRHWDVTRSKNIIARLDSWDKKTDWVAIIEQAKKDL